MQKFGINEIFCSFRNRYQYKKKYQNFKGALNKILGCVEEECNCSDMFFLSLLCLKCLIQKIKHGVKELTFKVIFSIEVLLVRAQT